MPAGDAEIRDTGLHYLPRLSSHPDDIVREPLPVLAIRPGVNLNVLHSGEFSPEIRQAFQSFPFAMGSVRERLPTAFSRPAAVNATMSDVRTPLSHTTYPFTAPRNVLSAASRVFSSRERVVPLLL